ncbi:DUF2254 family protein [Natronorubrum halophilum]|uniref:DUF2254 family protein n=1 Tax=Natronorubrum halophilum TaxID=1702106 RepID=UPI001EE96196|nr:DUF2254 family protein [Natronorubrum halophilum]
MNLSTSSFKQFGDGIPTKIILTTFFLPLTGFILMYATGFTGSTENTRMFLSTLAGAQAGILAIVFSVTVIGVQLIATRYSPRMISLFTDSPIFVYTFTLFVLSIAVDLGLLYTVPSDMSQIHAAGVGAVSGLGLATAVTLLIFVRTAIKQSTPDGAIDAFVSDMTSEKYLDQVKRSVENGSETAHPMHPLYNLTMNALSDGEHVTAGKAVQEYGELVEDVLKELDEEDVFSDDRKVAIQLFKPVFKEHLHGIALHAEEKEENRIVSDAIELQYKLGKKGLDLSTDTVTRDAQFGLSDVLRDAPVDTGSYISNSNAWKQLGQLLVDASERPEPGAVRNIASSIDQNVSRQIWKVSNVLRYHHSMMRLYSHMENSHKALLDHYGEELSKVDMEWQYEHVPDNTPGRERIMAVFKLRQALFSTTETFLRYSEQEDQSPIKVGDLKDSWKNICVQTSKSPAEDYAISLCQALIEIAVIDHHHDPTGIPWSDTIARVKHKGDPEIVDKAFNRIFQYSYVEEEPGLLIAGETEERYQTYYCNQLNIEDYQPLNTVPGIDRTLDDIQRATDERYNTLRS